MDVPLPIRDLRQYSIALTPHSRDGWHLSIVTREYWTLEELANNDFRCDTLGVVQDVLDGFFTAEQDRQRAESDQEPSTPPT